MICAERIRNLSPQQRQSLLARLTGGTPHETGAENGAEKTIVAYVVCRPGQAPSATELRQALKPRLPEFMVPTHMVFLESLPLNPNGKVDRNALPAPLIEATQAETTPARPHSDTEAKLLKIWAEVLSVAKVGVEDNFFRLGGHSLLVLQVMAQVRNVFQTDLPLKTLFEFPTVAGLAEAISRLGNQPVSQPIRKMARRNREAPVQAPNHSQDT